MRLGGGTCGRRARETKAEEDDKDLQQEQKTLQRKNEGQILRCGIADPSKYSPSQLEKQLKALKNSGWHSLNENYVSQEEQNRPKTNLSVKNQTCSFKSNSQKVHSQTQLAKNDSKTNVLLSDEEFVKFEQSNKAAVENHKLDAKQFKNFSQDTQQSESWSSWKESTIVYRVTE